MINDIIAMLQDLPRTLAVGWAAWFAIGLGLSIWLRREKEIGSYAYAEPAPTPRPKSGPRPGARPAVKSVPPPTGGDAFGDLEQIFNQVQEGTHRMPGEAPAQAAAPAVTGPVRNAPVLAAPQSLP